ncbi:MAG: hypothetical protein IT306_30525 [Chloroflexi bacterium]|nr:hypothetical protein [Chloroflexota bacterium]
MQDTRTDDPRLEQEGLEHTESDPDQQRPFRDEFDVKPESPSEGGGKGTETS